MKKSEKSKKNRIARAKRGYKKFEKEIKFKNDRNHNRSLRKQKRELAIKQMNKVFEVLNEARSKAENSPIESPDSQSETR